MDDLRVALKFLLAFAMSRKDSSLQNKFMGKYEKMMVHGLTHWWVNGYDSTYRGIKDFLLAQKTMQARVSQFSNGSSTVARPTQHSTSPVPTAPKRNNEKEKTGETNNYKLKRDKQGKEDREKYLQSLFDANNIQAIASLASRHEGRQCYVHGKGCKHNIFQCSIFDKMEAQNPTTATAVKSLITEILPTFDHNDNQFARRTISDATRANNTTSNDTTRGVKNTNSTVNDNSMYSVFPKPSILLCNDIINDTTLPSAIAPPIPMTADQQEPLQSFNKYITPNNTSIPSTNQQQEPKCILLPPSSSSTTAIPDSGCTYRMTGDASLFCDLNLYSNTGTVPPTVTLGDDKHTIQATGWGILDLLERNSRTRRLALFFPDLGPITLLSIKQHTSFMG